MIEETALAKYARLRGLNAAKLQEIAFRAQKLIVAAELLGVVVTIETSPQPGLAMGNYKMRAKVRLARPQYQEEMALKVQAIITAAQS